MTLAEGPFAVVTVIAVAVADRRMTPGIRTATVTAAGVGGAVGLYDDLYGEQQAKGFRGHLTAARHGRLTSGMIKLAGVTIGAAAAAVLIARDRPGRPGCTHRCTGLGSGPGEARGAGHGALLDVFTDTVLIAGLANLANLFDLRPGRALKVTALATAPTVPSNGPGLAVLCSAFACAPSDLAGTSMLGDCGANALGAAAGVAIAQAAPRPVRWSVTAVVVGLTAASEKVSFSQVIAGHPRLRRFDEWGRTPA